MRYTERSIVKSVAFRTLVLCAVCHCLVLSGCVDDTFDRDGSHPGQGLSFEVHAPGVWSVTPAFPGAGKKVSFSEIDAGDGTALYLVTEVCELPDSVPDVSVSRGTVVDSDTGFYESFGLSAICYDGDWPKDDSSNDWTDNLAHDVCMKKYSGGFWDAGNKEDRLEWPGSGNVRFFAYAPHSSFFTADGEKGTLIHSGREHKGVPEISYTVAVDVKKQVDLLTATAGGDASAGGSVPLKFTHALTAVTVRTGSGMLAGTVSEVSLSGVSRSGSHRIGSGVWSSSGETVFTAKPEKMVLDKTDGDNHYTPSGKDVVAGDLTFLMIPQKLGESARLTIKFTDELTGTERTLSASLSGQEWKAGNKVAYSISSTGILVEPEVTVAGLPEDSIPTSGYIPEISVRAFAGVYGRNDPDKKYVPLKFTLEYSDDGGNKWHGVGTGKDGEYKGPAKLSPRRVFTELRNKFGEVAVSGSEQSPVRLESHNGSEETANCYMIHGPGYYSFPAVYGNAIKNGSTNTAAYTFTGDVPEATSKYVLVNFIGHDDKPIQGPNIPGVRDAVLVWQDSPSLVTDVGYSGGRISFRVAEETLCQGNAVIAVRDASGTVLWSWHIWVTHYRWDDSCLKTLVSNGTDPDEMEKTYLITPCNLGFCDPHDDDDEEKEIVLRVRYTAPDGKEQTKEFRRPQVRIPGSYAGDNTYYQWGRKDPMPGGVWNDKTKESGSVEYDMRNKKVYAGDGFGFRREETGKSIGYSIKNPGVFFMHDVEVPTGDDDYMWNSFWRRHWHGDRSRNEEVTGFVHRTIMNYWDTQSCESSYANSNRPNGRRPVKTIYDPCPAGFCVGNANALCGIGANAQSFDDAGVSFINDGKRNIGWSVKGIDFHATGLRDMGKGHSDAANPPSFEESYPAFSCVTFLVSTNFMTGGTGDKPYYHYNSSALLSYFDNRDNKIHVTQGTNNAYGFTVRPIKDEFSGYSR